MKPAPRPASRPRRARLSAILGSVLFFALAPGTVAGLVPFWLTGWRVRQPFAGLANLRLVGVFLVLVGAGSLCECFARLAVKGLGTPAPVAPPAHLVVSGQYRHVRNPMYLAVVAIVIGQAAVLASAALLAYSAVLWLLFHAWVVLYEERSLAARFGVSYQTYRQHVRRWWPRIAPWKPQ